MAELYVIFISFFFTTPSFAAPVPCPVINGIYEGVLSDGKSEKDELKTLAPDRVSLNGIASPNDGQYYSDIGGYPMSTFGAPPLRNFAGFEHFSGVTCTSDGWHFIHDYIIAGDYSVFYRYTSVTDFIPKPNGDISFNRVVHREAPPFVVTTTGILQKY